MLLKLLKLTQDERNNLNTLIILSEMEVTIKTFPTIAATNSIEAD